MSVITRGENEVCNLRGIAKIVKATYGIPGDKENNMDVTAKT